MTKHAYIELGLAVLQTEAAAISALTSRLDNRFYDACDLLLQCEGRVVVTGMGKSGHIGNKISATLASTVRRLFSCIRAKPVTVTSA